VIAIIDGKLNCQLLMICAACLTAGSNTHQ